MFYSNLIEIIGYNGNCGQSEWCGGVCKEWRSSTNLISIFEKECSTSWKIAKSEKKKIPSIGRRSSERAIKSERKASSIYILIFDFYFFMVFLFSQCTFIPFAWSWVNNLRNLTWCLNYKRHSSISRWWWYPYCTRHFTSGKLNWKMWLKEF